MVPAASPRKPPSPIGVSVRGGRTGYSHLPSTYLSGRLHVLLGTVLLPPDHLTLEPAGLK
jgi:hypothetical protein